MRPHLLVQERRADALKPNNDQSRRIFTHPGARPEVAYAAVVDHRLVHEIESVGHRFACQSNRNSTGDIAIGTVVTLGCRGELMDSGTPL